MFNKSACKVIYSRFVVLKGGGGDATMQNCSSQNYNSFHFYMAAFVFKVEALLFDGATSLDFQNKISVNPGAI